MAAAPKKTMVMCVSHKEDADGISSAALIRKAFGGKCELVDYPGQMEAIEKVASNERLKALYICDLGLNRQTQDRFAEILEVLRRRRVAVTYIDHHDMDKKIIARLEACKVRVIHDIKECTTVQVYEAFKSKLPDHASFVAACAAITDYMEDRPRASKLLQMYDRQFALINATVLTYNIVGHQKDPDYLQELVLELASSKYPYEIDGAFESARTQVEKLGGVISVVKKNMKTMSHLSYMYIEDMGASGVVNFVMGLSGKDVGIACKERVDYGMYAVSIRGSAACKVHLGRLTNKITAEFGGSGGGHDRACGATVPKPKMAAFIKEFNRQLASKS